VRRMAAWCGGAMGRAFGSIVSLATAMACGGEDRPRFPDQAAWHVRIARSDTHPTYSCEGTVDTAAAEAQFLCVAERFGSWNINGSVEQFRSAVLLQLWIRGPGSMNAIQPDIAVDLEPVGDRLRGWATVVLPDGTGSGHPGATAEAWL
jgi:hypothetical protein